MRFWEYLLRADSERDLCEEDAARDWLFSQPWWPRSDANIPWSLPWTDPAKEAWKSNLLALRSIVARLQRPGQYRQSTMNPIEADMIVRRYFEMMRPYLLHDGNGPITAKNFRRIIM